MEKIVKEIYDAVVNGNASGVKTKVQAALDEGVNIETLLNEGMIAPMKEVGQLFESGEYFVPEMLIAARAMQAGMTLIRPVLLAQEIKPIGKVVIGTVKGDLHDIGKNLVSMMLEGAGFQVTDLGIDASPAKFVEAVRTQKAQIVGMAAMLTTTMPVMKAVVESLSAAGLRDQVKVLIGGAPVTSSFAKQIGADAYAPDAASAVDVARQLAARIEN
jgi:5-methyltetrahydrofolate--homocysteine methyltransferase